MSGSSVPEAARAAAALELVLRLSQVADSLESMDKFTMASTVREGNAAMAWARSERTRLAAASVELQQEVDSLSAECEALRGTVAEERATTGRRAEDLASAFVRMADERGRPMGERAIYITAANAVRAALASPGEGE